MPEKMTPAVVKYSAFDKASYITRVCRSWDIGIVPPSEVLELLGNWKNVFIKHPILDSPAKRKWRFRSILEDISR